MYSGILLEFLNMGGGEIALIMVVVLLLFGGKKLPELARGLGKGIREFKDASEGVKREIHRNINNVGLDDELKDGNGVGEYVAENYNNERHHPSTDDASTQSLSQEAPSPVEQANNTEINLEKKNKETEL